MSDISLDFSAFQNVIGGRLESANKTRHNQNPSTLEANPEVPVSTRDDVDRAVKAAQEAAATWANVSVEDRRQAVIRFAGALEILQDDFATLLVKEQGKPFQMARLELSESIKIIRGMAELPFPGQDVRHNDEAAAILAALALLNSGQVCIAIKRIYIHSSIYDRALAAMADAIKHLIVGDGFKNDVYMGPIQNLTQYNRVKDLLLDIERNKQKIANTQTAHGVVPGKGYFIPPTMVDDPPEDSRVVVEEAFGPVFPTLKWTDEEDVIRRANRADVGLGASVWTRDLQRAERIAKRLQAGNVWVNTHSSLHHEYPFGGHKQSGIGLELGTEGLKSYCNVQTLHLGQPD